MREQFRKHMEEKMGKVPAFFFCELDLVLSALWAGWMVVNLITGQYLVACLNALLSFGHISRRNLDNRYFKEIESQGPLFAAIEELSIELTKRSDAATTRQILSKYFTEVTLKEEPSDAAPNESEA